MFERNEGFKAILVMMILLTSGFPLISTVVGNESDQVDEKPFLIKGEIEKLPPLHTRWGSYRITELYDEVPFLKEDIESKVWIVQFDGPIKKEWKTDLNNEGFTVLEYLPEFSFTVNVGKREPQEILEIDNVIAAGPFPSGLKMDPRTYNDLETGTNILEMTGEEMLIVDSFRGSKDVQERLKKVAPVVKKGSDTRYLIGPTITARDELISIEGISHIEPDYGIELHNNVSKDIIDVEDVWDDLGLDGTDQIVTVADTGLDTGVDNHSVDGDINLDFDNRATIVNWAGTSPDDGHSHGTHVAGSVAGDGTNSGGKITGMAPNASIFFQAIMADNGALSIPTNTSLLFQQAYDNGSRIHTNSWGAAVAGQYISRSQDVDRFLYHHPDMIILYSAGNSGIDWYPEDGRIDHDSIGSPGTAKNCITVGASENNRSSGGYQFSWGAWTAWKYINGSWVRYPKYPVDPMYSDLISDNPRGMAAFSSVGPTDDGRIKPDVVAPGTNILSCRSSVSGAGTGWGVYDSNYVFMGGTSMSTPITAGAVVLMREYFNRTIGMNSPSGALLKASLINGAMDLTPGQYGYDNSTVQEIQGRPDMHQGWGRINISNSLNPLGGNLTFLDDKEGLWTGKNITSRFQVKGSESDLRVTLAYSDYPGALYASKELVNDLDLILTAPNGTRYNGNDWISPFNDTYDRTNPVEGITIQSPAVGTWMLTINAYNVPMGPQHFAVAASGDISNLSSFITMDSYYYSTEGDPIIVKVVDEDLIGNGSVTVNLNSTSDPKGINLTLNEIGSSGLFQGTAWTVRESSGNLSSLNVSEDDVIYAVYRDSSPSGDIDTYSIAKNPVKVNLEEKYEHRLIQSEYERIHFEGRIVNGTQSWWTLEGSAIGWRTFHDNGNSTHGDRVADDGNISDIWVVPENTTGNFTLKTRVLDPFLGNRTYTHFVMDFNSSLPRYPKNVTVDVLPRGNTVVVNWSVSNETDLSYYNVYRNSSAPVIDNRYGYLYSDGFELIASTTGITGGIEIGGLADGVEYSFRVSVVDSGGNESSPSVPYNATPQDIIPPNVTLMTIPRTIVGIINFEFTGSPDLQTVQMQYYNDANGNGLTDDGDWEIIGEGPYTGVEWDTRISAGGPGDIDSLFIRYRGIDESNNTGVWNVNEDFRVDNTGPPSVSFTNPPPAVTKVMSHLLSGTTEEFSKVEVYINDILWTNVSSNSLGGFELTLNLTEGRNHVLLSAYDRYGAGPTNRSYNFTLDTQSPVASFDTEDQDNITRNIQPDGMELVSTSLDYGLDPNFTYLENLTWKITDPIGMSETRYGMDVLNLTFTLLGNYSVMLTVRDPAGNSNSSTLGIEVVDTTAPIVEIIGDSTVDEDETVSFDVNVTDNDVRWFNREGSGVFWEITGINFRWNSTERTAYVSFPEPGNYTLNITVTDGGGNSRKFSRTITVTDKTPPDGNILGPSTVILGIPASFRQNLTDNNRSFPSGAQFSWNLTYQEVLPPISEYFDGEEFTFNFTLAGSYMLTLLAADSSGNQREVQMLIRAIGDITSPSIVSISPAENDSFQFPEDLVIRVTFSEEINSSTISLDDLRVTDEKGEEVNFTYEMNGPEELRITPQNLEFGMTYTFEIGEGILDLWDNSLIEGRRVNYTIRNLFSLDFPDGVYPSDPDQNFTGNQEDIYNITLRFTNPVQVSSVVNAFSIYSIRIEETTGSPREIREEISYFIVNPGPDRYSVVISIPLDRGTLYNATLGMEVRDVYDYQLDKVYSWEFRTYIPEIEEEEEEPEEEEDVPKWLLDPIIWIMAAVILLIFLIIIGIFARARRKKNLEKIWEAGTEGAPRRRAVREEPEYVETVDQETEEGIGPEEGELNTAPPPSYEDLYGGIQGSMVSPAGDSIYGGPEETLDIDIEEESGKGIQWDEDEDLDELEDEWEKEEEDDWEEETEEWD